MNYKKKVISIFLLCIAVTGCNMGTNTGKNSDESKEQDARSSRLIVDNQGNIIGTAGLRDATSLSLNFNLPYQMEDGVTWKGSKVMSHAFSDCTKLKDVWIENSYAKITDIADDAFEGCSTDLNVHGESKSWKPNDKDSDEKLETDKTIDENIDNTEPYFVMSEDGVCLASSRSMYEKIIKEGKVTFPEDSTLLRSGVLGNGLQTTEIVIPANVSEIEGHTFQGLVTGFEGSSVKLTFLGNELKKLGEYAFSECDLGEVDVPEGVEKIDDYCFLGCKTLKKITFPSTLKEASKNCIDVSVALTEIVIKSKNVKIDMPYDNNNLTLYCYKDSEEYRYVKEKYTGINIKLLK